MEIVDVLAIRGSIRKGSHNRSLLRAARRLADAPLRVEARHDITRLWRSVLARVADDRPAVPA